MDKSETYIKMMQCNPDLIYPKWEKGFQEGDYIYDGKAVHVLGHDYVGVRQFFQPNPISPESPHHEFRIALLEPLIATSYVADESPSKIDIKTGKYIITTVYNAIWLPRQDQLQEMVSSFYQKELGILEICELWDKDPAEHRQIKQAFLDFAHWLGEQYLDEPFTCVPTNCFETGEQLWLAFVMSELYSKHWNGEWDVQK